MVMGRCKTELHYDEIEALVAEYPWFSAAKVLLLRHYVAVGNREREATMHIRRRRWKGRAILFPCMALLLMRSKIYTRLSVRTDIAG